MNLLGIDVGTTGLKAVLFDSASGRELGGGYVEYALETPGPDRAEIDPETWFSALKTAARAALDRAGTRECAALAISSQGESFVLLDRADKVLRPAIVWMDSRSGAECAEIEARFGRERLYHTTGDPAVDPVWLGTKLLHLRKNEPEIWRRIARIMLAEDYLVHRLTGEFRGNGALWCSTLLYDINRRDYFPEMLDFLEVSREQLPRQIASGRAVAPIRPEIAEAIGFATPVTVVSGGMDQACSALGSGNVTGGTATDNTGTSFNLAASCERAVFDRKFRLPCQLHVVDDMFLAVAWSTSGGVLLRAFRDVLGAEWAAELERNGRNFYAELDRLAASAPPGANGVLMLPHLAGALCPELDADATGAVLGLTVQTTRADLVRAMLESVACMGRANLELLKECGVPVSSMILTGGAARSRIWNEIKAGIAGIPARTLQQPEAGCLGAAMLAGLGIGVWPSPRAAAEAVVRAGEDFAPAAELAAAGDRIFARYQKFYRQLKPLFKEK